MTLFPSLVVWALADSLGLATLLIPVWLLLDRSDRAVSRAVFYLGCVYVLYSILALLASPLLLAASDAWSGAGDRVRDGLALSAGLLCLVLSAVMTVRELIGSPQSIGKLSVARLRATRSRSPRGLLLLAMVTAPAEALTMFPYLAFLRRLDSLSYSFVGRIPLIGLYCAILVTPALVLVSLRAMLDKKARSFLVTIRDALERNSQGLGKWLTLSLGLTMILNVLRLG